MTCIHSSSPPPSHGHSDSEDRNTRGSGPSNRPTTTINTGSGDDFVEILMGDDQRVHVKVNGQEVWSGTEEEFEQVRINTGSGNDFVFNEIDGADVSTGSGDDVVWSNGDNGSFDVGSGNDELFTFGDGNHLQGGSGNDRVSAQGDGNHVDGGAGRDRVEIRGDDNVFLRNSEDVFDVFGEPSYSVTPNPTGTDTRPPNNSRPTEVQNDPPQQQPDPVQASRDAAAIREAVEGWGTDEDELVRILSGKSNAEIRAIKQAYQEMYGESLTERIDDETSGALCRSLLSMLEANRSESSVVDPVAVDRDVERLHLAMSRWPADGNAMADVLTDRSTAEIDAIEAEYQRRYGVSLRQRIREMTGGDTQTVLLAQLDRHDGTELHATTRPGSNDDARRAATQTARSVHEALNRVPLADTDALIQMLGNQSNAELREIKAAYQQMYGQSLEQAVKNRTGGDFEDAMVMILTANRSEAQHADPTQATRDAAALREAVEGWGTDEEAISRMLANKSPAELRAISDAYREMYGESLRERIDDETSGSYGRLLLSRLDAAGC